MAQDQVKEGATLPLPATEAEVAMPIKLIYEHLADEGFRPKIDDDGSIGFKCEGLRLYLDAYDDSGGFRLYVCVYWQLDQMERAKAINTANYVNADRRCIKAFVNSKNTVWITHETHCADAVEYARTLNLSIEFLVSACREYREEFRRQDEPVPAILN